MRLKLFTFLVLFGFALAPISLFAQTAEISPYGGYVWPNDFTGIGDFKGNQILGVRGGGYVTDHFEIGGNYNWNNHFQPRNANPAASLAGNLGFPQGAVRANLWEAEFTYNFGKHNLFGSSVRPYVVLGGGGLTARIKNEDEFVFNVRAVRPNGNGTIFVPNDVLESGDTFFTFSYGGGVKTARLWGPMGVFGDFRGRTVPNFFGHANTWPELSAGLHFSWGE
jgi:Outer membrane protein beta-barrel domain